jgi:CcmD family protein
MISPLRTVLVLVLLCAAAAPSVFAMQPTPERQEQYVPLDQLPPQEQMAAAPLLITAYVVVIVVFFVYVFSVARRLTVVQREIERLDADLRKSGKR